MKYLLDTNAWVAYMRGKDKSVISRLESEAPESLFMSSVVLAELLYGAHRSGPSNQATNLALVDRLRQKLTCIPFDDQAAEEYGRVRSYLSARGEPIGPNDLLIAATALAHRLTLVTHNLNEFRRVPGLMIEDRQGQP